MKWEIELLEGVAIVRMRSNKVNKQNPDFFVDLREAFRRLEREYPQAPVVLTGNGQIFSVGIDFEYSFPLFLRGEGEEIASWFGQFRASILRVFTYPRPTVAAVNGHAFAGGLILALACDFRIAVNGPFRCGINEIQVGIPMPSVYIELIRDRLGSAVASEAILTGAIYSNQEGQELGFYHRLVAAEDLMRASVEQAKCVPEDCLVAYSHSKEMLLHPTLRIIERESEALDARTVEAVHSPASLRAQARALEALKARRA